MIAYQKEHGIKAAAVIGGGLLGLEAAKAMYDLGMETHIIEYAPILMCRQVKTRVARGRVSIDSSCAACFAARDDGQGCVDKSECGHA